MKKSLTHDQRKKIERFVLYPLVGLIGVLIVYLLLFASTDSDTDGNKGANTEITDAKIVQLEDDKTKIYKNVLRAEKDAEREYIKDMGMMLAKADRQSESNIPPTDELYLDSRRTDVKPSESVSKAEQSIIASTNAYRDINRNIGTFYETPKKDDEKEQMQRHIEEMEAQQLSQMQQPQLPTMDEQVALLEKSYQLAAKYMPKEVTEQIPPPKVETKPQRHSEKVTTTKNSVVSSLSNGVNDAGFITAVGVAASKSKNTISAVVHTNQTITDGGAVRLRLTEPTQIGDYSLPRNAIVTGYGKIQGERLYIAISSIEHSGNIKEVDLTVIDGDGQEGIFIPNSMEINAVKEMAANLGGNMSTTINLNQQSAGNQILTDLGKGAIEGASQYVSKKLRLQKVHLKAGYKIMLYHKKQ